MYTQGLDSLGKDCLRDEAPDGAALESRFQSKVDAEDKIEPKDWMPEAYRRTLIRQISHRVRCKLQIQSIYICICLACHQYTSSVGMHAYVRRLRDSR
jgi:hypothetical protein